MHLAIDAQNMQEQRECRAECLRLWVMEKKARRYREDADRAERRERAEREERRHSEMMQVLMFALDKKHGRQVERI